MRVWRRAVSRWWSLVGILSRPWCRHEHSATGDRRGRMRCDTCRAVAGRVPAGWIDMAALAAALDAHDAELASFQRAYLNAWHRAAPDPKPLGSEALRCRHCGKGIERLRDGGWNHENDGFVLCVGNVGTAEPEPLDSTTGENR